MIVLSNILENFSILVASFDEVQDILMLWDKKVYKQKIKVFKKFNLYYGLNYKAQNQLKTYNTNILYSETFNWSLSLEKWIHQIDSKYILILLDDHIIKNFSLTSLESIIKDVNKNKILYAPLTYGTNILRNILNIKKFVKGKVLDSKYSINLQPAIWEKSSLLRLLKETTNPWDFEIHSSRKYKKKKFNAYFYVAKNIIFYEQYVERGKIYPQRFYKIFNSDYRLLTNRAPLEFNRRIISHIGYIYKILKEFISALISMILYKY